MKVGIPKETWPGETRVAVVPAAVAGLVKAGLEVVVEQGAGVAAGFVDEAYRAQGAAVVPRAEVFKTSAVVLQVRATPGEPAMLRPGQAVIGFADPLGAPQAIRTLAATGATLFSMELMPRITRAQSMDALSSMATIAGYKAVLLAADVCADVPMLMTAAGPVSPARVFIMGAGVPAGRRSHRAPARRQGGAYDVRPAVKEQVQSWAKFVERPLESADSEDKGAATLSAGRNVLQAAAGNDAEGRRRHDVVITRADPGKPAPTLLTTEMGSDGPGSVSSISRRARRQLRADQPDEVVVHRASRSRAVHPPRWCRTTPARLPKNITTFLTHLIGKDGAAQPALRSTRRRDHARDALTRGGESSIPASAICDPAEERVFEPAARASGGGARERVK